MGWGRGTKASVRSAARCPNEAERALPGFVPRRPAPPASAAVKRPAYVRWSEVDRQPVANQSRRVAGSSYRIVAEPVARRPVRGRTNAIVARVAVSVVAVLKYANSLPQRRPARRPGTLSRKRGTSGRQLAARRAQMQARRNAAGPASALIRRAASVASRTVAVGVATFRGCSPMRAKGRCTRFLAVADAARPPWVALPPRHLPAPCPAHDRVVDGHHHVTADPRVAPIFESLFGYPTGGELRFEPRWAKTVWPQGLSNSDHLVPLMRAPQTDGGAGLTSNTSPRPSTQGFFTPDPERHRRAQSLSRASRRSSRGADDDSYRHGSRKSTG